MTSSGVPRIRRPAYCSLAVCFIQLAFSAFTRIKTTSFFYPWKGTLCAAWLIRFSSGSSDVQRRRDGKDQLLPESNRTILFVHVGKAGGETIKSVLEAGCQVMRNPKRRTKCLATLPATYLSFAVAGYFHCFKVQPMGMAATANSYLFNVRHPVDRSISWYHYVSPHNCRKNNSVSPNCVASYQLQSNTSNFVVEFFQKCFPTVDDWAFAATGKRPNGSPSTESCAKLAKSSLTGQVDWKQVPLAAHMTANYQHYIKKTVTAHRDKEVLVVRMNQMWGDLKALDWQLGGTGNFGAVEGSAYTHGSESYKSSTSVSDASVQFLCCALLAELEIYRDLIVAAANLRVRDKRETIQEAVKRCGWNSWEGMTRACVKRSASIR